jgi:hypothetical protein
LVQLMVAVLLMVGAAYAVVLVAAAALLVEPGLYYARRGAAWLSVAMRRSADELAYRRRLAAAALAGHARALADHARASVAPLPGRLRAARPRLLIIAVVVLCVSLASSAVPMSGPGSPWDATTGALVRLPVVSADPVGPVAAAAPQADAVAGETPPLVQPADPCASGCAVAQRSEHYKAKSRDDSKKSKKKKKKKD